MRNKSEVSYQFKINMDGIDDEDIKEEIKKEVGDFLIEETLKQVGEGKSPIKGGTYNKKLKKEYAKEKGLNLANMELDGDLLDALTYEITTNGVKIVIRGDQAIKAYAHHTSYRGHPFIKDRESYKREFIPNKNQEYKKDILDEIENIVEEYKENGED
jgi:hypothetical protein